MNRHLAVTWLVSSRLHVSLRPWHALNAQIRMQIHTYTYTCTYYTEEITTCVFSWEEFENQHNTLHARRPRACCTTPKRLLTPFCTWKRKFPVWPKVYQNLKLHLYWQKLFSWWSSEQWSSRGVRLSQSSISNLIVNLCTPCGCFIPPTLGL